MRKSEKPVSIVEVEIENFRRLTVAEIKLVPKEGLVRVTGPNAAGKTSLLKAIAGVLGGAGEVHPESKKDEAKTGRVALRLSNGYTVERRFTDRNAKGYLTVTGPDEGQHRQSKLAGWLGSGSFDPLAFFSLKPEAQRDTLFSVAKDPELPKKLADSRRKYAAVYDDRTPVIVRKRDLARTIASAPAGEPPDPIDTKETLSLIRSGQALQVRYQSLNRQHQNAMAKIHSYETAVSSRVAKIEDLEQRSDELLNRISGQKERLKVDKSNLSECQKKAEVLQSDLSQTDDPAPQIAQLQEVLASASEVDRKRQPWLDHEKATMDFENVATEERTLTEDLKNIKAAEGRLLAESGIPVKGIGFDEAGTPLLNDRSLELASGRERIEVAVSVALAADPQLRVCLLDEANELDLDAMKALDRLARKHHFQIWCVRIGLEGPGEIVVEDGVAKSSDQEEAK